MKKKKTPPTSGLETTITIRVAVGPDRIEAEGVGLMTLNTSDLINALQPYVRQDTIAQTAEERAAMIVADLTTRLAEFEARTREWLTAELVHGSVVRDASANQIIDLVGTLARGNGDADLRALFGSGPLTRRIFGHYGFRYTTPRDKRLKLADALFNLGLGSNGRPSTLPPMRRLQIDVANYEQQLQPLAAAIADNHPSPLQSLARNAELLQAIRDVGLDVVWCKRGWAPLGRKQDKVSARSLAIEFASCALGVTPQYLSRALSAIGQSRSAKTPHVSSRSKK